MKTNVATVNQFNYHDDTLNRAYHSDIAKYRIEDNNIDKNIRLRDSYFKELEEVPITYEDAKETLNMSDSHNEHFNKLNDILSQIDDQSKEYEDIKKAETLIDDLKYNYEFEYSIEDLYGDDILLTNSNLDEDLKVQYNNYEDEFKVASYKHYIDENNLLTNEYDYSEEMNIDFTARDIKPKSQNLDNTQSINKNVSDSKTLSQSNYSEDRKIVEKDNNIFFFGQELSNFHKQPFEIKGRDFHSSEQAFMYCKAKHFNDNNTADKILNSSTPKESKKLGREVENFDVKEWDNVSEKYMNIVLKNKFESNEELKDMLLDMKDKNIVECSPFDRKWGAGISVDQALNGEKIKGENKLGQSLMNVRDSLLLEQKAFATQDYNLEYNQNNLNENKLMNTLKESKIFVDKVESKNVMNREYINTRKQEIHELLSKEDNELLMNSYRVSAEVDNISYSEMSQLYNYSNDVANVLKPNNNSLEDLANELQTYDIIDKIENEIGDKNVLDSTRKDYLVSNTPKPMPQSNITDNERLNIYINNNNNTFNNINEVQMNRYIKNANTEITDINDRSKANEIKNNNVFQKFNSQFDENTQNEKTERELNTEENSKKKNIQIK